MTIVVLFRRELRFFDNTALNFAAETGEKILPVFIFTPEQTSDVNKYRSNHAIRFMVESLIELDKIHPLTCFYGVQHKIIDELLNKKIELNISGVFANMDYTKYAITRDENIRKICEKHGVVFKLYEDILLNPIGSILTQNGEYYQKYTPYKKSVLDKMKNTLFELHKMPSESHFLHKSLNEKTSLDYVLKKYSSFLLPFGSKKQYISANEFKGGRKNGLKKLNYSLKYVIDDYNKTRNYLNNNTTKLSPYIKFGCLSIREIYNAYKLHFLEKSRVKKTNSHESHDGSAIISQLIWRDFYYNVGYGFPQIYDNQSLKPRYDNIKWTVNNEWLNRWKLGLTGYPIVDAGMRELYATGYMHNRSRLITSGFLVKILMIDWREGETWFSQNLIDIDRAINNGNWQWSSGSGADSQPYFRIINPWRQSVKFDPNAIYIKKWIPELNDIPANDIHNWYDKNIQLKWQKGSFKYPSPIVDYKTQRKLSLELYQTK